MNYGPQFQHPTQSVAAHACADQQSIPWLHKLQSAHAIQVQLNEQPPMTNSPSCLSSTNIISAKTTADQSDLGGTLPTVPYSGLNL